MNSVLFSDPIISGRVCLTLLHSVWQVTLLVSLVRIVDWLLPRKSVQRSYLLHAAALSASLIFVPLTFWNVQPDASTHALADGTSPLAAARLALASSATADEIVGSTGERFVEAAGFLVTATDGLSVVWWSVAPWLLSIYITGVALMLCRLGLAGLREERERRSGTSIVTGPLTDFVHRTSQG